MANESYAIVVRVPEGGKGICFMAIPFSEGFKGISDSILKAASQLKYQPFRTDEMREGPDYVKTIFDKIRSAEIVVAVCSPDPKYKGQPNPNVMYELGLAHSLGKPTLIMTNAKTRLSDIPTKVFLKYSQNDVGEDSLILEIKNKMRDIRDNTQDALIERGWDGISVAHARHRMLLEPDFWDKLRIILTFGKRVHRQFQALESAYVKLLLREEGKIADNPKAGAKTARKLDEIWDEFSNHYYAIIRMELFDKLQGWQKNIEGSFDSLSKDADTDIIRESIGTSKDYYENIKECLEEFRNIFRDIAGKKKDGSFRSSLKSKADSKQLCDDIRMLANSTSKLTIHADCLMRNLINLILPGE